MRKEEVVTVPDWGDRDAGKKFLIREMPAAQAEKWGMRAIIALKGSGARIPEEVRGLGMIGVAIVGMNAFLQAPIDPRELDPLLDEMMTCVKYIRDPRAVDKDTGGPVATPIVSDDDIEEVHTRLWLRSEVLRVHTNFSAADALSAIMEAIKIPADSSIT